VQALLEILALFIVFVLFRSGLKLRFPATKTGVQLSEESLKAVKKFSWRYALIFIVLGVIFSWCLTWLIYFLLQVILGRGADVLVLVEITAIVYPALVLGFLLSSLLAPIINSSLQKDGLAFFLEEYEEELQGFSQKKIKGWQIIVSLVLATALLVPQSGIYIKLRGNELSWDKPQQSSSKTMKVSSITKVDVKDRDYTIYFNNGDSLSTVGFSEEKHELIEKIKPRI